MDIRGSCELYCLKSMFLLIRRKVSSFPSSGHFANLIIFLKADYCTNLPNSSHFFSISPYLQSRNSIIIFFCRSKLFSYKNPWFWNIIKYKMNVYQFFFRIRLYVLKNEPCQNKPLTIHAHYCIHLSAYDCFFSWPHQSFENVHPICEIR